ncbi:DNA polymerase III subunit delta' [Haloimpatiens lingqiaonensis]|uniref:DNA polymerase III subunit delta' n=1 Tax=Haloimpatiens lingqiaonensis TaxID=1380675 RepID=UPI0010FF27BC|nr:DNA polymerase III subunit delta' [Haloimpatiens lingqiaonensis]
MSFKEIIGHEDIKEQMMRAIEKGMLSHAHLIVGEDGIGKSTIAKAMALKILGKTKDMQYPDIIQWRIPKKEKSLKVDHIRELIEEINKKPHEGDKKVVIVHEAHKMTEQAQNALLKTIEEPPKGVVIILLCEKLQVILETIKSRCQIHTLRALSEGEIRKFVLREYEGLNIEEVDAVVAFSDGIPGRAEKFIEDEEFHHIRDGILQILISITKVDELKAMEYESFFNKYKEDWEETLNCGLTFVRDAMIFKETGNRQLIINKDKIKNVQELANVFSYIKLNAIIDIIGSAMDGLRKNVNSALIFEMMLLKLQEV